MKKLNELTDDEADAVLAKLGLLDDTIEARDEQANDTPTIDDNAPLGRDGLEREPVTDADFEGRTKKGTFAKGNQLGERGRRKQAVERKKARTQLPTFRSTLKQMVSMPRKRDRFDVEAAARKLVRTLFKKAQDGDLRAAELVLKYLDIEAGQHAPDVAIQIVTGVPQPSGAPTPVEPRTHDLPRLKSSTGRPGPHDLAAIEKLKASKEPPPEQSQEIALTGQPTLDTELREFSEQTRVRTWTEHLGVDAELRRRDKETA